jgi:ferritin-like metal-binding protein YciE
MKMTVDSIEKLLVEELKDLHSAETQITKALPKLIKAASSQELKKAFETHLKETEGQIERLDQIFEILGKKAVNKTCVGMKGLITEGSEMMQETEAGDVRDAALISAAQRVEHYEISAYGTVRSYAEQIDQSEVVDLLEETLEEEKATDEKLTQIAKKVNSAAKRAA